MLFRRIIEGFLAIGFFSSWTPVNASVIKFDFSATVNNIFEYSGTTKLITDVTFSTFPGSLISVGDQVSGYFSYDTSASLINYYQPPVPESGTYQMYQSNEPNKSIAFSLSSGLRFESSGASFIQVANNASNFSGWDIFNIRAAAAYSPVMFQEAGISLFDNTAKMFSDSTVPSELPANNISYRNLNTAWLRRADGNQLQFSAKISSISVSQVPEPSSYVLLTLGLAYIGAAMGVGRLGARARETAYSL